MSNQRQDYRYVFKPQEQIPVRLEGFEPDCVQEGTMVNLSLGGTKVHLGGKHARLAVGDSLLITFALPGIEPEFHIPSTVSHLEREADGLSCSLRFLPLETTSAHEARSKLLWRFLLDRQRRALHAMGEAVADARPQLRIYVPPQAP